MLSRFIFAAIFLLLFATFSSAQKKLDKPKKLDGSFKSYKAACKAFRSVQKDDGFSSKLPSDSFSLLRLPQVRDEVDVLDDQYKDLRRLEKELKQFQKELLIEVRDEGTVDQSTVENLKKRIGERTEDGLHEILLPHQVKRIRELQVQVALRNRGNTALADSRVNDVLKLSDAQREALSERQAEINSELRIKLAEIKEQMEREALEEVLDADQLSKLDELVGARYDVRPVRDKQRKKKSKKKKVRAQKRGNND